MVLILVEVNGNLTIHFKFTLFNYDFKFFFKIITNRIKKVLEHIVHPDQTCSVPGCSIVDNLHLMS